MQVLNYKMIEMDNCYHLLAEFETEWSLERVWNVIATNDGFKYWFEQLSVDPAEQSIIFSMDTYFEKMPMITYELQKCISYQWQNAIIQFKLVQNGKKTIVFFEENMPKTFPHPNRDLAGWLVKLTQLQEMMSDCQGVTDTPSLFQFYSKEMRQKYNIS